MKQELAKSYQPKDFEDRIYQMWNDSGSLPRTWILRKNRIRS